MKRSFLFSIFSGILFFGVAVTAQSQLETLPPTALSMKPSDLQTEEPEALHEEPQSEVKSLGEPQAVSPEIPKTPPSPPQILKGRLFEKGTRIPLKDVSVYILPEKQKVITDAAGYFEFQEPSSKEYKFVVVLSGYQKLEVYSELAQEQKFIFYLEKESYLGFETTITSKKDKRDDSAKTLTQEEFLTVPGAQGDPVKAVQNLPGVNRVSGFSSQVVIQGSAPEDTTYDIDGHEIPLVFHFGGLTSVVMPEAISSIDYLSAGYGPEYSRAMGGVISLKTKNPDPGERDAKGFFFVDTLKTGGQVEGRINDHSEYLVAGRYSYVGQFLKAAIGSNSQFNLTTAPDFADLTMLYHNKLNERDDFKLDLVGSRDTLGFVLTQPLQTDPSIRGNFSSETDFFRLIPQWTRKLSGGQVVKASLGVGEDKITTNIGSDYFNLTSGVVTTRAEWEIPMNSWWKTQIGTDDQFTWNQVNFQIPETQGSSSGVSSPVSISPTVQAQIYLPAQNYGAYFRNEILLSERWTFLPSLRADNFSLTNESFLDPRMGFRYKWSDSLTLKTATGIYHQPPQPQQVVSGYGNPNVRSPSADHFMLGFEKDFKQGSRTGYSWNGSYFYRYFNNLVIPSSNYVSVNGSLQPEYDNNNGGGNAQGVETLIRYDQEQWAYWISYTLSRSVRWDPSHTAYNYKYDQTHNLNLVADYSTTHNWKYSGRFRYVTGDPYTPVSSAVFDADNDVYIPFSGSYYSTRVADFRQLDIRIDKKFIYDHQIWSFYVDIQNVLNTQNVESVSYSYDYTQNQNVTGLPFLPAVGVKGEF